MLTERFGVAKPEALAAVLLYRATGPFTTAACGAGVLLVAHVIAVVRARRVAREH